MFEGHLSPLPVVLFFCCLVTLPFHASANGIECPATETDIATVDFTSSRCRAVDVASYEMGHTAVWLKVPLALPEGVLASGKPVGLFISANMSLTAYVNRVKVGNKGQPAIEKIAETTGPFDWVAHVDKHVINQGQNELVLFASGHANALGRNGHFNRLYLGDFASTTNNYARHYAPSLITLGAMLMAVFYLLGRGNRVESRVLIALVLIAMLQLLVEVSRGVVAYAYPLHLLRLYAIAMCAFAFGQLLLLYALRSTRTCTRTKGYLWLMACSALLSSTGLTIIDDYDYKAIASMLIPAALGFVVLCASLLTGRCPPADKDTVRFTCASLGLFLITMLTGNEFLDSYLYFFIAALLLALTKREADTAVALATALEETRNEAEKLALALEINSTQATVKMLKLKSAGRITHLPTDSIVYAKAAGDYVELICDDKTELYSGNLRQLKGELPPDFLKVHRSYLVNAKRIRELRRQPSGNGELKLHGGETVPVSRTLFSQTKAALA